MPLSGDEYRHNLINKILLASSQEEVKHFIDTAIKTLAQNKVNGHIIYELMEKTLHDLRMFSPMKKNAQQWSNIKMAMILCSRIKSELNAPVNYS